MPDASEAAGGARWKHTPKKEVGNIMNSVRAAFAERGLVRVQDGRILGGVAAGLGRRFGFEPWTARLLFVLVLMLIPGSQLLVYPILWILMPDENEVAVTQRSAKS
ncbi:MAG TPA: PspC domain-containing protein [Jatrophihabitans sp.]|nr:PspC domain-containing protein [Jatrophihabitans sp.]